MWFHSVFKSPKTRPLCDHQLAATPRAGLHSPHRLGRFGREQ